MTIDPSGALRIGIAGHTIVQRAPVIYQETAGARTIVDGRYLIENDGDVVFQVARFDATRALVIDPVLIYSTFLGGSLTPSSERGWSIAIDATGIFLTGSTPAVDFPTIPGAFDTTSNGSSDVFVVKLNPAGSGLEYRNVSGRHVRRRRHWDCGGRGRQRLRDGVHAVDGFSDDARRLRHDLKRQQRRIRGEAESNRQQSGLRNLPWAGSALIRALGLRWTRRPAST